MSDDEITQGQLDALMADLNKPKDPAAAPPVPAVPSAQGLRDGAAGGQTDLEPEFPLSPTLLSLSEARQPSPLPACAACPRSTWFASATELQCHCGLLHAVTWNNKAPDPILICDGILLAEE